jgi:AMMECR1 domain-containing protein
MGTLEARHPDLVLETMDRALGAAFEDPRFPPLTRGELDRCAIEVSILGPLEEVRDPSQLDPSRYGVEVSDAQGRRAVLLPGVAGLDTWADQLAAVRRKAGIPEGAPVLVRRFVAEKVGGPCVA